MNGYMPPAKSDDWATPQALFDQLNHEFNFMVDAAASSANYKAPNWFGLDHPLVSHKDGLAADWSLYSGAIYVNPPYGRGLTWWVSKAFIESKKQRVVMLLPARTDTHWFHEWVYPYAEIRFLKGRVKYGAGANPAPFPSMVVIFHPQSPLNADEMDNTLRNV